VVCEKIEAMPHWFGLVFFLFCSVFDISFNALTLLVGQQEGHPVWKKTEWWRAGVVICLEQTCIWPS